MRKDLINYDFEIYPHRARSYTETLENMNAIADPPKNEEFRDGFYVYKNASNKNGRVIEIKTP